MKYKTTPLNILCALLTGLEIVFFAFPQSLAGEHYGYLHIFLIPVILLGFLVDYILQSVLKKYLWLFLIESVLIIITALFNIKC